MGNRYVKDCDDEADATALVLLRRSPRQGDISPLGRPSMLRFQRADGSSADPGAMFREPVHLKP